MAEESVREQLESLHESLVKDIKFKVESGIASADDMKLAVQLLKNSSVSAPVIDGKVAQQAASELAGKLDFSGLEGRRKVLPFRPTAVGE